MTPELEKMTEEVYDLATVMRPFLMSKQGQVSMSTLCMLASEVLVNTGEPGTIDNSIALMAKCVSEYVEMLQNQGGQISDPIQ